MMQYLILWLHFSLYAAKSDLYFLYPNTIFKEHYKLQKEDVIKLTFTYSKQMKGANKKLIQHTSDLMQPFDLSTEKITTLMKTNKIAVQLASFVTWVGKNKQFYEEFDAMAKLFSPIPDITYTKEISISIDTLFVDQQLKNLKDHVEQIKIIFTEKGTLDSLMEDDDSLTKAVSLLEFLNNDVELYITAFYDWFNSLRLAQQQFISKQVRLALLNKDTVTNQLNINFLTNGIKDESPIFFLKVYTKKNPYTYQEYIPIAYNQLSLAQGFHYNINESKFDKFYSQTEIEMGKVPQTIECLKHLNDENIQLIIEKCHFQPNLKHFQHTNEGIIFFSEGNSLIREIKTKFDRHVGNNFPFYISFNDTISFKDDEYGDVTITKKSPFDLTFSSLTQSELDLFNELTKIDKPVITNIEPTVLTYIEQYFTEDYMEILINVSFVTIFFTIFLFLKRFGHIFKCNPCNKFTMSNRQQPNSPIQKAITKRLNANPNYNF